MSNIVYILKSKGLCNEMKLAIIILFCPVLSSTLIYSMSVDTIRPLETVTPSYQLVENLNLDFSAQAVPHIDILVYGTLKDTSGVVQVNDGVITLQTVNSSDGIVWSSNTSRSIKNLAVQLLDAGNLVLRAEDRDINNVKYLIWQSFDHPVENVLPGMKLGIDLIARIDRYYTLWKSYEIVLLWIPQVWYRSTTRELHCEL